MPTNPHLNHLHNSKNSCQCRQRIGCHREHSAQHHNHNTSAVTIPQNAMRDGMFHASPSHSSAASDTLRRPYIRSNSQTQRPEQITAAARQHAAYWDCIRHKRRVVGLNSDLLRPDTPDRMDPCGPAGKMIECFLQPSPGQHSALEKDHSASRPSEGTPLRICSAFGNSSAHIKPRHPGSWNQLCFHRATSSSRSGCRSNFAPFPVIYNLVVRFRSLSFFHLAKSAIGLQHNLSG